MHHKSAQWGIGVMAIFAMAASAVAQTAAPIAPPPIPEAVAIPVPPPANVAGPIAPASSGEEKNYSYGKSGTSILFLPDQISRMKEAVRSFEDGGAMMPDNPPEVTTAQPDQAAPPIQEPAMGYPVFYLSSIAYNGPADWSIWVSGHKITSKKNDTNLVVTNVTPESATFIWKPTYMEAISKRRSTNQFANIEPVKNKLAAVQAINFDELEGQIVFRLRQNQAFVVSYFKIFEGYMDGVQLQPLIDAANMNGTTAGMPMAPVIPSAPPAEKIEPPNQGGPPELSR